MQLDVFIPDLYLAVEYQGEQHYRDVYSYGEQRVAASRDKDKRDACNEV